MKKNKKSMKTLSLFFALPLIFSTGGMLFDSVPNETHSHNDIVFSEWTSTTTLPDTAGSYYLTNDVILNGTWEVPAGINNLCLNGYVISLDLASANTVIYSLIDVTGATLNIYDCKPQTQNYFSDASIKVGTEDRPYWVHNNALQGDDIKHTISGGVITGGVVRAIEVLDDGVLNMYGGTICMSNCYTDYAGAVYVYDSTFNMYEGATITENYSQEGGGVMVYGTSSKTEFNMYGGVISHNKSFIEDDYVSEMFGGGGVSVWYGTFNMYDGLITENEGYSIGGGVKVCTFGTFNMYGGEISKNKANAGGGIAIGNGYESCTANLKGGKIIDNTVKVSNRDDNGVGGGLFIQDGCNVVIEDVLISGNDAEVAGGGVYLSMPLYQDPYYCVTEGTKITLGDGSTVNVEDLKIGDEIRVFDHDKGELSTSTVFYLERSKDVDYGVKTLHFTNDIDVSIVSGHSFFSREENKYVTIEAYEAANFIGKEFYNADKNRWETLLSVTDVTDPVDSYSIVTNKNINLVTNEMLSCGDQLYLYLSNIFDFGENLRYDEQQKIDDINTYGLYTFEECSWASKETYEGLNLQYLKVAIGKGVLSQEFLSYAAQYQSQSGSGLGYSRTVFFGGATKVTGNTILNTINSNLQVWSNTGAQIIQVGTDTNGVSKPKDGMEIGVSYMKFDRTSGGTIIDLKTADIEYYNYKDEFPVTGEEGILYCDSEYRVYYVWDGNQYNLLNIDAYHNVGAFSENGSDEVVKYFTADGVGKEISCIDGRLVVVNSPITKPVIEVDTFVYNGNEKTFEIPENDLYEIVGETKATEIGEYEVTLVLKDKEYSKWADDTTDDITYKFTINQRAEDVAISTEGECKVSEPVIIVEAPDGIKPQAVLVVKVIAVENETDVQAAITALNGAHKIGEHQALFGLYDAKLLIGNTEVQPDGTIVIKMYIPDELQGKTFKLYHLHNGDPVLEVTYETVSEGKYLKFETDKLSQFAFVGELEAPIEHVCHHVCDICGKCKDKTCNDPVCAEKCTCDAPKPVRHICFMHWLMIATLVAGIGLFVLFGFVLNSKLGTLLTCAGGIALTILFAVLGDCNVCELFTIINLLIFAIGLLFAIFMEKKEKEKKPKEETPKEEAVKQETVKEARTLKDSLGIMATVGAKNGISKKFIAEYLKNKYGKEVEINCRANTTHPGKGQKVGLPLADTHYVFLGKKAKKCFIYVYENEDGKVMLLVDTTNEHYEKLHKEHKHITKSLFPKAKDKWYSIIIDHSWNEENLGALLDDLITNIKNK